MAVVLHKDGEIKLVEAKKLKQYLEQGYSLEAKKAKKKAAKNAEKGNDK